MPIDASGVAMITSQHPSSAALPAKHHPEAMPTIGTSPAEFSEQGERRGVQPGDDCVVSVAGSSTTPFCKQHDRQPESLDQFEDSVLFPVTLLALGPRQHRVVIGEHSARRTSIIEGLTVDPADPGHESVGRSSLYQFVHALPTTLCRDGQRSVLGKGARIAEVVDVLPCIAPSSS